MLSQTVFNLLAAALTVSAVALPDNKGYFSIPLGSRDVPDTDPKYSASLVGVQSNNPFNIPVTVGSQKEPFNNLLDTGSYDFYNPLYDYNSSVNATFENHGTGWGRNVDFITDISSFGSGPEVELQIGVFTDDSPSGGIIGAHFAIDHSPNYFRALKDNGYIDVASFSVWFDTDYNHKLYDPAGGRVGELIFGAYDKAKYQGPLVKKNLTHVDEGSWNVPVDAIVTPDGKKHFQNLNATFDTGNVDIALPEDVLKGIQESLPNSTWSEGAFNPIQYLNGNTFGEDDKLVFQYEEANIDIYLRDIKNGAGLSLVVGPPTFGAPFVSNAFTIFNLEEKTVSLANRKFTNETDYQKVE